MSTWICTRQNELTHHGIKGQKWGVRRIQNKDGSLTPAGKKRYDKADVKKQTKSNEKTYKIPKNKSLHRLRLEEKYRKQGLSQEQGNNKRLNGLELRNM